MRLQNQDITITQASALAVVKEVHNLTAALGAFEVVSKQRNGVTYPAFATLPASLGEMFKNAAETHAAKEFLVYGAERYSYAQLYEKALCFSHILRQDFKLKKGDKVIIAMRNYPEWMIAFMGITLLGAVVVPVNAWLAQQELLHVVKHSQGRMVISDDKRYDLLKDGLKVLDLPCLIARPNQQQGKQNCLMSRIAAGLNTDFKKGELVAENILLGDTASIFYTSGSTGSPKGAVSSHESILTAINTWLMLGAAAGIANGTEDLEPEYPPAALITVPLFHVTGCHTLFLLSMIIGRKTVMMPYWDAGMALELIEKERVSYFNGVPTMSMELMEHAKKDHYDLSSLTDICAGGAARAPDHVRKISQSFSHGNPSCGYGLTETNALGAVNGPLEYLAKPTSAGLPTPPIVEVQIFDEQNHPLPQGEIGEIAIKTLANITQYWQDPKATKAAFCKGYFKTGDLGFLDEEGFIHIVDRIKDIIIRGGENVSCLEVESALYKHQQIIEASVFALPDPRLGEVVGAVVHIKNRKEIDELSLKSFLGKVIAHFKVPSKIWLLEEKLPRLGSGKIDKRGLKTHYQSLL